MTRAATIARVDYARRRKGYKSVKLLAEHPDGNAYRLLAELTKHFFVARVRQQTGGPLVDKLLLDEIGAVDAALIDKIEAVDLVQANDASVRYALDGGFIRPIGATRRYIATLRMNQADESPIQEVEP